MIAYAGTGVGLVKDIKPAADIVDEVLADTRKATNKALTAWGGDGVAEKL